MRKGILPLVLRTALGIKVIIIFCSLTTLSKNYGLWAKSYFYTVFIKIYWHTTHPIPLYIFIFLWMLFLQEMKLRVDAIETV